MMAFYFHGPPLDSIYKIVSMLVSIGTLAIIILGYNKFLKNQLRQKQLDTIYELIRQIQQTDWNYLQFNKFENVPVNRHIVTLFDIAEMEEFKECEKLLFWGKDNEPSGVELLEWNFFYKFYSHPFLPLSIAVHLKKFNLWRQQNQVSYKQVENERYIAIGRKQIIPQEAYFIYFSEGEMKNCSGFRQIIIDLRDSIIKWTSKYGLNDLNITTSHIYESDKK